MRKDASPLTCDYAIEHGLCDYITASPADRYAVRETCELLIGLLGQFDAVVASRAAWKEQYLRYFDARQGLTTDVIDQADGAARL